MLDPRERALLLESLRPPEGYRLDRAVGTSYSLDLLALLTAPLAFTFFDWEDQDGKPAADPVALLESVRRHADRIHLFCQTGEIKLPPPSQRLVAYLERSVVPVQAPANRQGQRGIFHPKVWLLRYVAENEPVCYRLICATRNLTFDRSWDIVCCLDGELVERTRAIAVAKPIGEFIAALPDLALRQMDDVARAEIERMASEVQRVRFELPQEIEEVSFWPLGIEGYRRFPFDAERSARPLLIMAPFVSSELLARLTEDRRGVCTLISRPEQLASLPHDAVSGFRGLFALSNGAEDPEEDREDAERSPLAGLHAKLFIEDDGWDARLYVGSANATSAAFERNVEFMVELKGKRKDFGIDTFLGEEGKKEGLRALLEPWQAGERAISEEEAIQQALDQELAMLRRLIAEQPFSLQCLPDPTESSRYLVELRTASQLPGRIRTGWSCWLATQHEEAGIAIDGTEGVLARFGPIDLSSVSAFLACRISLSRKGIPRESRFVLNVSIEGLPEDRLDRLLASQIQDRDRLLRLLLLLLQPDGSATAFADAMLHGEGGTGDWGHGIGATPLFEVLVRATVDGKERIAEMGRLLSDLQRTEEGRALIPDALLGLWKEVSKVLGEEHERPRSA